MPRTVAVVRSARVFGWTGHRLGVSPADVQACSECQRKGCSRESDAVPHAVTFGSRPPARARAECGAEGVLVARSTIADERETPLERMQREERDGLAGSHVNHTTGA